jgi:hypothetical protein
MRISIRGFLILIGYVATILAIGMVVASRFFGK